jgi:hypothetical protein
MDERLHRKQQNKKAQRISRGRARRDFRRITRARWHKMSARTMDDEMMLANLPREAIESDYRSRDVQQRVDRSLYAI